MGIPQNPHLPPPPMDPGAIPSTANSSSSEFGVGIGYEARQARRGVPPDDGGPYRALAPKQGREAGKQHRRYGARKLAD